MSNLTAIALIMGVGIAHLYLYVAADNWMQNRLDAIVTGMVRGVAVPIEHRRTLMDIRWLSTVAVTTAFNLLFAVGYLLIGQYAGEEGVKFFANMSGFFAFMGALGWIVLAPFLYVHLRSILRQAEVD